MIHAIKAYAKSQKIPATCIYWLIDFNTLSVILKTASSVDNPFLKPYCSVTSMLLICRCWLNLLSITFLNILEKTINNEMALLFFILLLLLSSKVVVLLSF